MSRGPRNSQDRLLNLLYKKTVPEVKPRLLLVKRRLYEEPATKPHESPLERLTKYLWRKEPMIKAIEDMREKVPKTINSNILHLSCKNAFVGKDDIANLFPVIEERRYNLDGDLERGLDFHFIKARNPVSLLFLGSYYLVFPNFHQTCVYYLETLGKQVNGIELNLKFLKVSENHLKRMSSPLLHQKSPGPIDNFDRLSENYGSLPCSEIFRESSTQILKIKELLGLSKDRSEFISQNVDPIYDIIGAYLEQDSRSRLVIVRNLPLGVTGPALESLLWDYEFENEDNPQASIYNLYSNASTHITLTLMRFKDHKNARRFVRNYHGRRWEKVTNRKEKSLYEPLLCEIAD